MSQSRRMVEIVYRNWRQEITTRAITPRKLVFSKTAFHLEPQWFIRAYCHERRQMRMFALRDVLSWITPGNKSA